MKFLYHVKYAKNKAALVKEGYIWQVSQKIYTELSFRRWKFAGKIARESSRETSPMHEKLKTFIKAEYSPVYR